MFPPIRTHINPYSSMSYRSLSVGSALKGASVSLDPWTSFKTWNWPGTPQKSLSFGDALAFVPVTQIHDNEPIQSHMNCRHTQGGVLPQMVRPE